MDRNIIAINHYYAGNEAAAAVACYSAAAYHGLSNSQADACEDGRSGCPNCPIMPQNAQPVPYEKAVSLAKLRTQLTQPQGDSADARLRDMHIKSVAAHIDATNFIHCTGEVKFMRADNNDRRYFVINTKATKEK